MNHIEQAYQQGLRVRCSHWTKKCWVKKHSETDSIDEGGHFWVNDWNFVRNLNKWEIWHEDLPLFKQSDIKQQIQTRINQIQELLKQL